MSPYEHHSARQWLQSQPAEEEPTKVSRRPELAQPGYEVAIKWGTDWSFADHKDIHWSYTAQGYSEHP